MAKSLDAVIRETLENKIGDQVWKVLKQHIKTDIYDAYNPKGNWSFAESTRRKSGGLSDDANKYTEVVKLPNGTWRLRVTSIADPSPSVLGWAWVPSIGGFLQMLEKGDLGFWTRKHSQNMTREGEKKTFPRPAITNAQDEVNKNYEKYRAELYAAISKALS